MRKIIAPLLLASGYLSCSNNEFGDTEVVSLDETHSHGRSEFALVKQITAEDK